VANTTVHWTLAQTEPRLVVSLAMPATPSAHIM
jgi:hypothetical protein